MQSMMRSVVRGARVGLLAVTIWVVPAGFARAQMMWGGYGAPGIYGGYGYPGYGYGYPGLFGGYGGFGYGGFGFGGLGSGYGYGMGYGYPGFYGGFGYGYAPGMNGAFGYGYPWAPGWSSPFYNNPLWYSLYSYAGAAPFAPYMGYARGLYPGTGYAQSDQYENYYWYGPRYRVRTIDNSH
jgi:hypothetical protein